MTLFFVTIKAMSTSASAAGPASRPWRARPPRAVRGSPELKAVV